MGADGIMMATAFMATKECPINMATKEALVKSRPDDPQLRYRVLASSDPAKYAEVMTMRDKLPTGKWLKMLESIQPGLSESRSGGYDGSRRGKSRSERVGSLAVGAIDHVLTVRELVDSIIQGAETILDSWQFLKTR